MWNYRHDAEIIPVKFNRKLHVFTRNRKLKRVSLLQVLLALSCAVAMGENSARAETPSSPAAGYVAPSASDIELERLLSSTKDKRARVSDLFRFNLSHPLLTRQVYVGAHGEFFDVHSLSGPTSLICFEYRGGLLLTTLSKIPELGLDALQVYAQVAPNGRITYLVADEDAPADLTSRPEYWPAPDDARPLRPLQPGEVLFRPTPGSHPRDCPPPEGSTGWAFRALSGTLVAPLPGDARPENVVWVIPEPDGGFRLVYGGPKRHGELMMAVAPSCEVTLGTNTPYSLKSRHTREKRWAISSDHGAIMIPAGYSMSPLTDGTSHYWQSNDGSVHSTFIRY